MLLLAAQMGSDVDPGPTDKSVLYDQDSHVSSAVWDGQVTQYFFPSFFFSYFLCFPRVCLILSYIVNCLR